jgi:hypothetical protein
MLKFNKSILALCITLGTVNAKGLHGLYISADLGANYSTIDLNLNDGGRNAIQFRTGKYLAQPNLGLSLGYDHILYNSFLIGFEILADHNLGGRREILNNKVGVSGIKVKVERKGPGLGALAKFGTMIGNTTVLYVGLGLKALKYHFKYIDAQPAVRFSFGKRVVRPMLQVGLQGLIKNSDNLGWRATYSYVSGKAVTRGISPRVGNAILAGRGSFVRAKANEHSLKLGAFYRI